MAGPATQTAPADTGDLTPEQWRQIDASVSAPPGGKILTSPPVQQQAPRQQAPVDTGDLSPAQWGLIETNVRNTVVTKSPTGLSAEPQSGFNEWSDQVEQDFSDGAYGVKSDLNGFAGFMGAKSNEQMQEEAEADALRYSQMHKTDYQNTILYPTWAQTAGNEILKAIPPAATMLGGAAVGGGAALAVGASLPVTGTVALLSGAAVAGTLAVGGVYKYLTDQKVDPTTARVSAAAAGSVAAGLSAVNVGIAGKLAGSIAKDVMGSSTIKAVITRAAAKYLAASGANVTVAEIQGFATSATKYIATRMTQGAKQYTQKDWLHDFYEVTQSAVPTALAFTAAAEGVGAGVGAVRKPYLSKVADMTAKFENEARALESAAADKANAEKVKLLEGKIELDEFTLTNDLVKDVEKIVKQLKPKSEEYSALIAAGADLNTREVQTLGMNVKMLSDKLVTVREKLNAAWDEQQAKNDEIQRKVDEIQQTSSVDVSNISRAVDAVKPDENGVINLAPVINAVKSKVADAIQGTQPVHRNTSANKPLGWLAGIGRMYNTPNENAEGLLNHLAQDAPPDNRGVMADLAQYLHDHVVAKNKTIQEGLARMDKALEASTGKKGDALKGLITKLASTKVEFKYSRFKTGEEMTYHGSQLELAQDLAWARDRWAQPGLRTDTYTLLGDKGVMNWEETATKALNDDARKVMHGLITDFNDPATLAPLLQAFAEKNGGEPFKQVDMYYGRLVRKVLKGSDEVDGEESLEEQLREKTVNIAPRKSAANPVNTIERTPNNKPLVRTDMYLNAVNNVNFSSQLINWKAGAVFDGVFNDETILALGESKQGKLFMQELHASIGDSLHGSITVEGWYDKRLNTVMRKFGVVKLGGPNPLRAVMHAFQLVNFSLARNMTPAKLASGVADFWKDPIKNAKEFADRPFVKDRYENSVHLFIQTVKEHNPPGLLHGKVDAFFMSSLPLGDKAAAIQGWHAVLKAELDLGKPYKEAAAAADKAVDTMMYSASPDQMSNFQAGRIIFRGKVYHNKLIQVINIAKQIPTTAWRLQIEAVRDAINHPTAENYRRAGQVVVTTHVANALFEAVKTAWVVGTTKDPKRAARAWLDLVTSMITGPSPMIEHVVLSDAALTIRNRLLNRKDEFVPLDTYPQEVYEDITRCHGEWEQCMKEHWSNKKHADKFWVLFAKAFNETVTGLPEADVVPAVSAVAK